MRFKLTLLVDKKAFGDLLPINYQYEQSALIYKILSYASSEYASWLHENGFTVDGKQFKLFTYSSLYIPSYERMEDRLQIKSDTVEWYLSFLPEKSTEKFIQGIFAEQVFQLGDQKSVVQFKVQQVELLPSPEYKAEMTFQTMSPLCISRREENGKTTYLSPDDPSAKGAILTSLLSKYKAYYGKPYIGILDFDFKVLNTPKSKLVTIKANTPQQTRVKGYNCLFKLKAPKELMELMYDSGAGEKGSVGFGMCEKREIKQIIYNTNI